MGACQCTSSKNVLGVRAKRSLLSKVDVGQSVFRTMKGCREAVEKQMVKNGTTLSEFHARQKFRPLVILGPSGVGKGTVI